MAVIKCPECGSEISSESARCPNCGVPAEVWAEEISSSYSPPVASKNNSEEKHIVECCEESKGKGRFNKIIAAIVIVLLVALLGVAALKLTSNHLIGRSKSEAEYRSAVYAHITDSHGEAIDSYDSFVLSDNGEAYITVTFKAALEMGGYLNAHADLVLDDECNIISCSFCDTFGSHAGKSDEPTSENWDWDDGESTLYQEFILRKTEQLTGFVISLEMDNYEEHEIVENGHTYIDVFAFINIEEMAGTPIDVGSAFQLYALINPDNEEDLFIVITGNSTGEIYRYDHTSIPHETTDNDKSENNTSSILESEDDDYGQEDELVSTPENTDHEISRPEEDTTSTGKVTTPELIINETDQTVNSKYFSLSGYATDENYSVTLTINGEAVRVNPTWGTWSRDYTLTEGKNVFTIVATNEVGKSTTKTVTVVFNIGAPELTINETDQTVNSKYFSLSGYATDENYSVTLTINGEAVRVNPTWGTWSRDYTLTEGKNVFTVVATNEAGKSTTETVTIVFNTGAPE